MSSYSSTASTYSRGRGRTRRIEQISQIQISRGTQGQFAPQLTQDNDPQPVGDILETAEEVEEIKKKRGRPKKQTRPAGPGRGNRKMIGK